MLFLILTLSALIAFTLIPLTRRIALNVNLVSIPRKDRFGSEPVPLLGGFPITVSIIVTSIVTLTVLQFTGYEGLNFFTTADGIGLLITFVYFTVLGIVDDKYDLPSLLKLGLQVIPITVLFFTTNIQTAMPSGDFTLFINFIITHVWMLYLINAYNYMDNMDGIAGVTAIVTALVLLTISIINQQIHLAIISAAIVGASTSFSYFNVFSKTKLFMGDGGSLSLGFLLATCCLLLRFEAPSPFITWPVPIFIMAIPIFDTGLVFVSRLRRGQSFLQGGTDHLSHRVLRLGFGKMGTPVVFGFLQCITGLLAIWIMNGTFWDSIFLMLFAGVASLFALYHLEFQRSQEFITGRPKATE